MLPLLLKIASQHEVGLVVDFVGEEQVVVSLGPVLEVVLGCDDIDVANAVDVREDDFVAGVALGELLEDIAAAAGEAELALSGAPFDKCDEIVVVIAQVCPLCPISFIMVKSFESIFPLGSIRP